MKKLTWQAFFSATLILAASCNNGDTGKSTVDSITTKVERVGDKVADKTTEVAGAAADKASDLTERAGDKISSALRKDPNDKDFVLDAAAGGMMEVELGKIAGTNAMSAKVKEFGQMMVTDHSKANTELKALAAKKNIAITPDLMDKHKNHINELRAKKGADFDKAYMDMMTDDHKEDVEKFENEANKGNDGDVKAFASQTLPVLKKHLERANSIHSSMKNQ